jgi:hypothetical protein
MNRAVFFSLLLIGSPAMAETLPVPPEPPAQITQSQSAPVPDPDADGRVPREELHSYVEIRNFRSPTAAPGHGFTPGSQFRSPEDRKAIQTPGVSFTVPID